MEAFIHTYVTCYRQCTDVTAFSATLGNDVTDS